MSDAIEEIGRQKTDKRNEAMEAWAAMIYSDQNRRGDLGVVQETGGCGGSSVPKETYTPSDPKKVSKLKEIRQSQEAMKAEAARTQDKVEKGQQAQPVQPTTPPAEVRQADARVQQARTTQQATTERVQEKDQVREQAEVAQEEAAEATEQARPEIEMPATLGNTVEASEFRSKAMSLTNTQSPDKVERSQETSEPEPVIEVDSAEQAALMAAVKSGAGANPDLIAKAYVQAAGMEGVKGTLQEGLLQGFVVAL